MRRLVVTWFIVLTALVAVVATAAAAQGAVIRVEIGSALVIERAPVPDPTPGPTPQPGPEPANGFVQHQGSGLTLGGAPFRFSGTNMYWLALDDNVKDADGAPTYPTAFRIDDAMATAQAAGSTVVRAWAGTVGCPRCISPSLGTINPEGFSSLDLAVASARTHGQRLLLSLVDNWQYYHGSKMTYVGWRGKGEVAFFTDPQVIGDYQFYITAVLTHVNPYTGLRYADDPTIMGWETGNEMYCQSCPGNPWFPGWTRAVADHISSVAPRQLVVDGHGTDPSCTSRCLDVPSLDIPSVDMVDDHHYPPSIARVRDSAALAAAHGKAYMVGEYDWRNARGGDPLPAFLAAIRASSTAGDLFWALIPHADTTGFVDHDDGFQYFYPGRDADERSRTTALVAHAGAMTGRSGAPPAGLGTPRLTRVGATGDGVALTWRGVATATGYTVQRSGDGVGWTTVLSGVSDQRPIYGPTATDTSAGAVRGQRYRVRAEAAGGRAGAWSAVLTAG